MLVKFSTLADGVFIEQREEIEYSSTTRCFRFDAEGNSEYAFYGDLTSANPAPRWYHHAFKATQFEFA